MLIVAHGSRLAEAPRGRSRVRIGAQQAVPGGSAAAERRAHRDRSRRWRRSPASSFLPRRLAIRAIGFCSCTATPLRRSPPDQLRHGEVLSAAGFSVLDIDYRGFGMSAGAPFRDRHVCRCRSGLRRSARGRASRPERIILLGHSLGSGPAVSPRALSTRRPRSCSSAHSPPFPMPRPSAIPGSRSVTCIRCGSTAQRASAPVHIPVIVAHSRDDKTIPYSHALKPLCGGPGAETPDRASMCPRPTDSAVTSTPCLTIWLCSRRRCRPSCPILRSASQFDVGK